MPVSGMSTCLCVLTSIVGVVGVGASCIFDAQLCVSLYTHKTYVRTVRTCILVHEFVHMCLYT